MPPQGHGDDHTARCHGDGAGHCRTYHAPACAEEGHFQTQQRHRPGGIDQQEVEDNVDDVDHHTHLHGGLGITGRPQKGAENAGGRPGEHGQIENEEISAGQPLDAFVHLHPYRDFLAEEQGHQRAHKTGCQHHKNRLRGRFSGAFPIPCTAGPGNHG